MVGELADELGGLDVFVNNAGIGKSAPFLELSLEDWQDVLDVDLTGAFLCAQKAARIMVDAGTPGRIVNITSVHEHIPLPQAAAYCAAKGGLGLLTKVMALELGEHGITVNAIAPGEIATPMTGAHDVDPSDEERPRCRSGGGSARDRRTGRVPRLAGCALRHRQLLRCRRRADAHGRAVQSEAVPG